ncbi:hypothetical protein ABIE37_003732 [Arthrobacter bambusae]|uniref:Uncharacterized protein n=1 Tax=Arthrobacter bambusae TaxID=1338426 RepID=A0ABV2PAX7_9MICC
MPVWLLVLCFFGLAYLGSGWVPLFWFCGGAGMLAGKLVTKAATNPVVRLAVENGVEGAISGAGGYLTGSGPHAPSGLLGSSSIF